MKLTHKLCGAVLLAAVGTAVALPNATKADNVPVNGSADIEFTRNTTENTTVTDPTGSSEITDWTVTDPGEFGIMTVSPLDFDKHAALDIPAGGKEKFEYWAKPATANKGNADQHPIENLVQFKDDRSIANHSFKLSAELTKNFTAEIAGEDAVELKGSTLTYNKMRLITDIAPALKPVTPKFGENGSETSAISFGGGSKEFLVNDVAAADGKVKGKGTHQLTFGSQKEGTAGDAIKLEFDADTDVRTAKYNATVTWTLAEVN
ncbi:hypothetical protein A5821_002685 [Enterococcus sp. 7F3_DIV0205]|uniref:WxL domain-containing protein n=1 Tax=Candidatus Enterococcus palustris TaxID=1834189 RepID=A0AAQ3WAE3_9ENTE|nr:WxL domain-containing protein [Enterococcus sp. 7F3_DIV0205]OTN83118.1 hypothetical protein A5821_003041 [Enterococcus sp. 7F3_DIV0205]